MNLNKLNENLNIHQGLPSQPTLSAEELKKEWDKPVNIIKDFINDTLIPDIKNGVDTDLGALETALETSLENMKTTIIEEVKTSILELETSMENLEKSNTESISNINTNLTKKTVYGDFLITRNTYQNEGNDWVVSTSSRNADLHHSVNIGGYYPIALVGVRGTSTEDKYDYRHGYLSDQKSGGCTAHWFFTNNEGGSYNANSLPSCEVTILWVKVR